VPQLRTPGAEAAGPSRRGRLAALDGLRVVAACAVLAWHWFGAGLVPVGNLNSGWGHVVVSYGWLGVNLFFLISGFVICMSAWGRSLGDFFTSRVARLFPAYWFAVALTAGALAVFPDVTGGLPPGSFINVLLNFTMVQQAYGGRDLDLVYWTLFYEARFYLLFAIVLVVGVSRRSVVAFCALWTTLSVIAAGSGSRLLDFVAMPKFSPYFIAGTAFYLIYRFGSNHLFWAIVVFNWLVALGNVRAQAVDHMTPAGLAPDFPILAVSLTACFGLLALVALHRLDRVQWRWLVVAGALTYPMYLLHQSVGLIVNAKVRGLMPAPLVALTAFAVVVLLSWLTWRLVEVPLGRRIKAGLKGSFAASDPPAPRHR
jgi:peptidoglycan/LPS O-acetylase OafA/YrhL